MSKITGYDTHDDGPGFVGIRFCQECNNMLYPKEDKENKVLMYAVSIASQPNLAVVKREKRKKVKKLGELARVASMRGRCNVGYLPVSVQKLRLQATGG